MINKTLKIKQIIEKPVSINIEKYVKKFSAMLTLDEAELLFNLAKNSDKKGVILEIGSYKGGSTIILAKGSEAGGKNKVYAIDPHILRVKGNKIGKEIVPKDSNPFFLANIKKAGCENKIVPIFKYSKKAAKKWDKPISLLWIDGSHNYLAVRKDILAWEKHLIEGGTIAFHDSASSDSEIPLMEIKSRKFSGVYFAMKLFIINSSRFENIKITDSITYMKKMRNATYLESLKNIINLRGSGNIIKNRLIYLINWRVNRLTGWIGILIKKISPKNYTLLKPYFPDKKIISDD